MVTRDLSPRERAIVLLAAGTAPSDVASQLEVEPAAVEEVARRLGWPKTLVQLQTAARAIERSGSRHHRGDLAPAAGVAEVADEVPVEEPAPVESPASVEELDVSEPAGGTDALLLEETAAVLQVLEQAARPVRRAQLVAPLVRAVGPDGSELVVVEVVVDVDLHEAGALRVLAGDADPSEAVTVLVEQRLTPDGVDLVRDLQALLPPADAAPVAGTGVGR